jgi:hypothetical protein
MGQQNTLQLGGGDLEALVLDQLLDPAGDLEPPVPVGRDDVPGVQPSVPVDHRRGGRRVPEVAVHDSSAADQQLAGLAGADLCTSRVVDHPALHAWERGTDRFGFVGSVIRRGVTGAAEFGQAVPLLDAATDPRCARAREIGVQRRGSRRHHAKAREVEVVDAVAGRKGQDDRRDDFRSGNSVVLHGREERIKLEPGQDDHRGSLEQREVERDLEAENVEQRQRGDHDVVISHPVYRPRLAEAGDEVAVRQHDTLREARRPARPCQERDIGRTDANGRDVGVDVRIQRIKRNRAHWRPAHCAEDEGLADTGGDRAEMHLLLKQLDCSRLPRSRARK